MLTRFGKIINEHSENFHRNHRDKDYNNLTVTANQKKQKKGSVNSKTGQSNPIIAAKVKKIMTER